MFRHAFFFFFLADGFSGLLLKKIQPYKFWMHALHRDWEHECVFPALSLACCVRLWSNDLQWLNCLMTVADLCFLLSNTVLKAHYLCLWKHFHEVKHLFQDFKQFGAFVLQCFSSPFLLCHLRCFANGADRRSTPTHLLADGVLQPLMLHLINCLI